MQTLGLTAFGYRSGRWITLAVLMVIAGSVDAPLPQASGIAPPRYMIALRHHHRPADILRRRNQTVSDSFNWSGYAVTGANGSVTDVKSSWVVPSVAGTCATTPNGYAAFWTGIDGWTSSTVEQIGTDSDCVSLDGTQTATPTYYAWFEFYPQDPSLIGSYDSNGVCQSNCVFPGDTISAEVQSVAFGGSFLRRFLDLFTVTITDQTQGWTFTTLSSVHHAKQSSAEWIAEAPSGCDTTGGYCQLSNFAVVNYGDYFTSVASTAYATVAGATQPLGSFGSSLQEAVMVTYPSGSVTVAQPSGLQDGGTSFSITWQNAGP